MLLRLTLPVALGVAAVSACAEPRDAGGPGAASASSERVAWWSEAYAPDQVALEPHATVDDAGRVWAIWIRFEPERVGLELVCSDGQSVLARTRIEVAGPWIAEPQLAPLGDGVLCAWEEGGDSPSGSRLVARTASLAGSAISLGDEELALLGRLRTPRLCRTRPDRLELVGVAAPEPAADLALVRLVRDGRGWSAPQAILPSPGDCWAPALAADRAGRLHVAWDHFDGARFRVAYAVLDDGRELERHELATGAGHQAHPSLALEPDGAAWIAWEEAAQFGQLGGLRGERTLGLARVVEGRVAWAQAEALPEPGLRCDLPQLLWTDAGLVVSMRGLGPSFAAAARGRGGAPSRPAGDYPAAQPRSRVYIDPAARFFTSWWTRVLCFDADGRARVVELPETEGDNLATESLLATGAGPLAVFAADLRSEQRPRPGPFDAPIEGPWRVGVLELPRASGVPRLGDAPPASASRALASTPVRELRAELAARGDEGPLMFGDLHRHTHLSRCAGANDGTTTDLYRYARGPGGLDFVAVTDHFQHLRPWSFWRNQRDVARFHAPGRLVVFSGIERASKARGHRNDVHLDPVGIPFDLAAWNDFPEVGRDWRSPDPANTISIPHMMGRSESPWRWRWFHEDLHRLFEVYQGARGSYEGAELPLVASDLDVPRAGVGPGLADGHLFGFIAASDHGASSAGLAGVHASERTREAIFAALRARRSFAATDLARIETRLGPLRCGEEGDVEADEPFLVEARGLAPVAAVEVFKNGAAWRRLGGEAGGTELVVLTTRRWGPYPNRPLGIDAADAELASWRARRRGALDVELARDDAGGLSLVKGREPLDLVLGLRPAGESAALELRLGDDRLSVELDRLPLDRTRALEAPFDREQLWRIGPSLRTAELRQAFDDPERRAGDSYYARVVFEDGNVVWSSPVRVHALSPDEGQQR